MAELNSMAPHLLVAGGSLAALVLAFVGLFLLPGLVHWFRLRGMQREIARFEMRTPPGELRRVFARDTRLALSWKEYEDTLHIQREERDGQLVAVAVRSTAPAEAFFNSQSVVDARLRTEFFKHLPGIFTGIGIIGTFTGLIEGLRQFQVSENAAAVRSSLESLMHSVGQAFLISAAAIGAAIVVTFLEKLLLSALYGRTEAIAQAIDARFEAGAGEDYLSRLVQASADASSQNQSLKDELVAQITGAMREQTDRQITGLAAAISASIEKSLAAPLQKIASAVQTSTGEQSALASQLLNDVMGRFGERLDAVLGSQVSNINNLNQQTGQGMQEAVQAVQALVEGIANTTRQSSDAMNSQLALATREMLDAFGASQRDMAQRSTQATHGLSDMLAATLAEMKGACTQMAAGVQALNHTTTAALDRMAAGASQLGEASQNFALAGDRVSGVMEQATQVSTKLVDASGLVNASAADMRGGLDDYRSHREAVGQLVSELRTTIELARKEAALTTDVLARIEHSSERLGAAQQQADLYLGSVSKVLAESHQAFAIAVRKTLDVANTEFHTKLSTAVGLLSSTVLELEATLGHVKPPER